MMKRHFSLYALCPFLFVASSASGENEAEPLPVTATSLVAQPLAHFEGAAHPVDGLARPPARPPGTGLPQAGLATATLAPSTGLSSSARGLTAPEEWRRNFPQKSRSPQ